MLAILAAIEAMTYCAFRSRRGRASKRHLLTGASTDFGRAVPLVDNYLRKKTAKATRFQSFLARKLAEIFRKVAQTRAFEFALLSIIQTAANKRRNTFNNMKRRVVL